MSLPPGQSPAISFARDRFNARCRVLAPRERLTPSQWCEKYRELTTDNAVAGRYSFDLTPWWREVIDQHINPEVQEIGVMKPVQVGWTTLLTNLILYQIDNSPAPGLIVMPGKDQVRMLIDTKLRPAVESCEQIKQYNPILEVKGLETDTCTIAFGTSGSLASIASRHICNLYCDEVEDYVDVGADPIRIACDRTITYQHRRKIWIGSAPRYSSGPMATYFNSCLDQRWWHLPCPHCGQYAPLTFDNVHWSSEAAAIEDHERRADFIEQTKCCYYQCPTCQGVWHDKDKYRLNLRGKWVGTGVKSTKVAYSLNALVSNFVTFSQFAVQFLRARTPSQMQVWRNNWGGEPYEDVAIKASNKDLEIQITSVAPPSMVVPSWAGLLTSGVDCGGSVFYLAVRAWGRNRSQLVLARVVNNLDDLYEWGLSHPYLFEDGTAIVPRMMLIDSGGTTTADGSMTQRIYEFSQRDSRIIPTKGQSTADARTITPTTGNHLGKPINLLLLNTGHFKDCLMDARKQGIWFINRDASKEYMKHQASEHKVVLPSGKLAWKPISKGFPNHFWDSEVANMAAAELCNVLTLPDEDVLIASRNGTGEVPDEVLDMSGLYQ